VVKTSKTFDCLAKTWANPSPNGATTGREHPASSLGPVSAEPNWLGIHLTGHF
jgi:hypothetical protein